MIPKIEFVYSGPYDAFCKDFYDALGKKDYPSKKEVLDFIGKIDSCWKKYENDVLTELSRVTGLKWKEKKIKCYVVGRLGNDLGFSDPFTLSVMKNKEVFIDNLVHELIHQIQNDDKIRNWFKSLPKKYPEEKFITKSHISVHAIHKHIYLKLFNKERLEGDIKMCQKYPDYKRAWEIVEQEGHENIINELKKRLK